MKRKNKSGTLTQRQIEERQKAIDAPPVDKMVREPERKKTPWQEMSEVLVKRENDIHSGGSTR